MSDGTTDKIMADPPRLDELSMLEGAIRLNCGNRAYLHHVDRVSDNVVIGYIGISKAVNTSEAAPDTDQEMSFINYAPVGSVRARYQDSSDEWVLDIPDLDNIDEAAVARYRRHCQHTATVLPAIRNGIQKEKEQAEDKLTKHSCNNEIEEIEDVNIGRYSREELLRLGMALGKKTVSEDLFDELEHRLESPYRGEKRFSRHTEDNEKRLNRIEEVVKHKE